MNTSRIQELRLLHKDTQASLADKLNVQKRTYASWERNERDVPNDILIKIADIYNVSTDYLLGRCDTPYYEQHQPNGSILLLTKKELPGQMPGEPTMRMDLGAIDDLPRDRKQLEQLVSSMIEKALGDHRTNQ